MVVVVTTLGMVVVVTTLGMVVVVTTLGMVVVVTTLGMVVVVTTSRHVLRDTADDTYAARHAAASIGPERSAPQGVGGAASPMPLLTCVASRHATDAVGGITLTLQQRPAGVFLNNI